MHQAILDHLGSRQVSRVIYGSIIGLALVLALELHPPTAAAVVGSLLGTAVAVALAEVYSDVIGAETRLRRPVAREHAGEIAEDAGAVAFGIAFPSVFFLLALVGAYDTHLAFDLAVWSGLGLITFYGFCAARLAGRGMVRALLHALVVGVVGGGLIVLKALIH